VSTSVGPNIVKTNLSLLVDPSTQPISSGGVTYTWYRTTISAHPTTEAEMNTMFATSATIVDSGYNSGILSWGNNNQALRWGGTAGPFPSYMGFSTGTDGLHNFAWTGTGQIFIPTAESYDFVIDGDDAIDFFVNGTNVSSWYGGHGFGTGATVGTLSFASAGWYPLLVRMEEIGGGNGVAIAYKRTADSTFVTVPASNLRPFNIDDKTLETTTRYFGTGIKTNNSVIQLNGTNNYVSVLDKASLKPANAITVSTWAFRSNWNVTTRYCLVSKTQGGAYQIGMSDTGQYGDGYLGWMAYLTSAAGYRYARYPLSSVSTGWHNFSGTFDGRYLRLYIDAVLVDTFDNGSNTTIFYGDTNHLVIGAEPDSGTGVSSAYFDGNIGQTIVYSSALSQNSISNNFQAARGIYGV